MENECPNCRFNAAGNIECDSCDDNHSNFLGYVNVKPADEPTEIDSLRREVRVLNAQVDLMANYINGLEYGESSVTAIENDYRAQAEAQIAKEGDDDGK